MNFKLCAAILILFSLALITPVNATVIIDEDMLEFVDTSQSGTVIPSSGSNTYAPTTEFDKIIFGDITKVQNLEYLVVEYPGNVGIWTANRTLIPTGSHDFIYTYHGQDRPGVLQISRSTNLQGAVTKTRFTIFLNEWDIGEYGGTQSISIPFIFAIGSAAYGTREVDVGPYTGGATIPRDGWFYVICVSNTDWKNHISVTDTGAGYDILLTRTVDDTPYTSTLNITRGDVLVHSSTLHGADERVWFSKNEVDVITVSSPYGGKHIYPVTTPGAPINPTLYGDVLDVYTGEPISGATITANQSSIGRTITATSNAAGVYSTAGSSIQLLADEPITIAATASGYYNANYSFQAAPRYSEWYVPILMVPTSAPDYPIEEGKSLLYGYAVTQGSQQPISGATVALDGYGTTTTTSTGFYSFVNVTPGDYSITTTAATHDPLSESVTVAAPSTQHNMALTGQHTLTIIAKDADTLANIQNATISLSDGQESTQNPITFTVDYGTYTITTAAEGYYPANQYQYIDSPGTTTATVLMTAKPPDPTPPELPNYPPHNVKFTVLTLLGIPIPDVNVSAQGFQQTPSQNILERLLGLNMTSTPINSELMSGTTDSNGDINFMMLEAVKYRIAFYKPDVVNMTLEIYPKEDTYPIRISTLGGPLLPDAGDPLRSILVNVTTSTDNDVGHIHIDYNDTTHKTTGLSIQVTQQNTTNSSAPEDVIASYTVANDANVTHTFDLNDYKGHSYFVRLEAEHPDFGTVHRDYGIAFKGVRVPLGPLPDGLYIYVAAFGLMLLGGIFGATSATRGVVVIALAGWLFYGFGWLDDLGLTGPVALGLVTFLGVMGVIITRYREEGYT